MAHLVESTSPVTIVGTAGVGKTRLATHVAGQLGDGGSAAFPDGVHVVRLGDLPGSSDVADAVGAQLGFAGFDSVLDALAEAASLIVLDNCEHVLAHVAEVVAALGQACPGVRIVATSREPLDVEGEHVHPLRPLDSAAARALLRQRAVAAGARLSDDAHTDHQLDTLVGHLDGLPLALELAAIRLRSLPVADIIEALTASADLLRRPRGGGDHRHDSLSNAIAWSYELLDHSSAAMLRRLAVCDVPFSIADAHALAAEPDSDPITTADIVDRLFAQSMLSPRSLGDTSRFRLPVTIRQFALERLAAAGELEEMRARYVGLIADRAAALVAEGTSNWSNEIVDAALDAAPGILTAVDIAMETETEPTRAFAMFLPAWGVVHFRHAAEFAAAGDRLLDTWPRQDTPLWRDVAAITATAVFRGGDPDRAFELAERALHGGDTLIADPVARRVLAQVEQHRGEWERALAHVQAGIAAAEAAGLRPYAAELRTFEATLVGQAGRTDEAADLAAKAHAANVAVDSDRVHPWTLVLWAYLERDRDPERSRNLVAQFEANTSDQGRAMYIINRHLAALRYWDGDMSAAIGHARLALSTALAAGEVPHGRAAMQWAAVIAAGAHPSVVPDAARLLASVGADPRTPASDPRLHAEIAAVLEAAGTQAAIRDRELAWHTNELLDLAEQRLPAATPPAPADPAPTPPRPTLRRRAQVWELAWHGDSAELSHSKGLADLARLVAEPDTEVAAVDLMGALATEQAIDVGVDATARREYEARLRELQDQIDEAETANDLAAAERAQAEFDQILDALTSALGLGGKQRKAGGSAEKARSAVTWRIRAAIKRIDAELPGMARHLRVAVRTGAWCSYQPEEHPDWLLD